MAKEKFVRNKPHCNIGTIGHVDQGKTTLTAAVTLILAKSGGATAKSYADVDAAPAVKARGITVNTAHVEHMRRPNRHMRPRRLPWPRRLCEEHDHRRRADGQRHPGGERGRWPDAADPRSIFSPARQSGVPALVVSSGTRSTRWTILELLELVEMEVRELLTSYEFPGDDTPIVKGSALSGGGGEPRCADGRGPRSWEPMTAVDTHIPQPERMIDRPFMMGIEDVFSISGRGTVVTGRIDQGIIKVGEEVEIVGHPPDPEDGVHGGGDVPPACSTRGQAGDNVGVLLRGTKREEVERGQVLCKPGTITPHTKFTAEAYILTKEEGGRQHAVLHQPPAAVLLPHHRRDRHRQAEGRRRDDHARRQCRAGRGPDHPDRHGAGPALHHP